MYYLFIICLSLYAVFLRRLVLLAEARRAQRRPGLGAGGGVLGAGKGEGFPCIKKFLLERIPS